MSSLHSPSLGDASSVQVALGAALTTAVVYKLLVSPWLESPPHKRYAAMHGLKDVKLARRLKQSSALLGDMPELQRNMHRFNDWIHDKTLECDEQPWILHVPTQPDTMVIASPALIEDITKAQNDIFGKGNDQREMLSDLAGHGISIADGKIWYHQRKVASKFFSARMFRDVATGIINKHADCMFDVMDSASKTGTQLNFTSLLHQFTLQTFAELGFGLDMHAIEEGESHKLEQAFDKAFPQVLRRVQTPTWLWKLKRYLGIGSEGEYRKTTQYLRLFVSGMIQKSIEKIRTEGERKEAATIVELFIHAMQDGEADFPPERLCDVAMVFVLGGRDTTADTLNWLFYMLNKHPDVEEKIRAELWQHVPAVMEGKQPFLNMEQTHSLVYMEAVIKETLRLYPVLPQNGRQASRDTVLSDGTFVPQGTVMALATYTMGRLESVWGKDAAEFKPERFIDETTGKLKVFSSYKFFSFHAGPRVCIGLSLAMLEMKLLIASLLSRFRLDTAPNDGQYDFSFLMPLKDPLLVRVRSASVAAPLL